MYSPHSLNGDRLERYHDMQMRSKYPLQGRSSLPMDLSALKTSTWTYKPAAPLTLRQVQMTPAPQSSHAQMRFRPEKAHRRPVQRLQWRKSKWQQEQEEPSGYLDLNRISSMTIADVSPKFSVKRILMLYENQQYREAANFVNRLSHGTFKVILADLPVDVFIESMPDTLPILEALYAKVFLSDGLNFSVKTLKPEAVVMHIVKFFAQQEESLSGNVKLDACGPFVASCKKLLKVIVHTDPKIRKMLVSRRKALDKAVEGMGHHGMVGTHDGSLMNLHDALKLEFKKVVTSYKAALDKLEELSLSTASKQTISRSISHGPAPVQVSHQRQLSITQDEIQERLIKNKTILNVVEPILGNHSLDLFLGILQRRIDHDKDCLFHFTQLKREVKDMKDAAVVVPILMRYGHGIDQVLRLMRDVSGDHEESDGSDISGYHSDSDSAIMTSGNSPYVSKSARYNFLYRSVRATPAQFRGGIPAFSACDSAAGSVSTPSVGGSFPSDTASVGDKSSTEDTSPQLETKGTRQRKRKEIEKRVSNASELAAGSACLAAFLTGVGAAAAADSLSSDPETVCSSGHRLPISEHAVVQRRKQLARACQQQEKPALEGGPTCLPAGRDRRATLKLAEHHQQRGQRVVSGEQPALNTLSRSVDHSRSETIRTDHVTSIDIDHGCGGLVRRYQSLYSHSRAEAMAALDALPQLKNSEELKSKLLFSVVVLAFRSVTSGQQAVRESVRRQLQIPPPAPASVPLPPSRADLAAGQRSAQLERTITSFLQQTIDTYDLSNNVEEVCDQIWATLYDYPALRTTEPLLSYVKESVRLSWGLINQTPACRIEYETRSFSAELHVRHPSSHLGSATVQTYIWPALLEDSVCLHKAVVIT